MPKGGPDNCGTCGFNRRNRGVWRNPDPDKSQPPFCEIRSAHVLFDLVTYCENWHTRTREPIGPIYSQGLYEINFEELPKGIENWSITNLEQGLVKTGGHFHLVVYATMLPRCSQLLGCSIDRF